MVINPGVRNKMCPGHWPGMLGYSRINNIRLIPLRWCLAYYLIK